MDGEHHLEIRNVSLADEDTYQVCEEEEDKTSPM
jgi:hypothetical protein